MPSAASSKTSVVQDAVMTLPASVTAPRPRNTDNIPPSVLPLELTTTTTPITPALTSATVAASAATMRLQTPQKRFDNLKIKYGDFNCSVIYMPLLTALFCASDWINYGFVGTCLLPSQLLNLWARWCSLCSVPEGTPKVSSSIMRMSRLRQLVYVFYSFLLMV